ncbi:VRR-NUC domain-containing protein [Thiolapillus sp.]|uniref:VRR-NUC domain-containing protein n=1 Tax=Thiolapillus sp. TaxID=2017437 RepID=UPI003AF93FE5
MKGSDVEKEVCAYAERVGFMSIKFKDLSRAGGPDRLFISNTGNVAFVEFKSASEPVSDRQDDYIMDLKRHYVTVNVVRDVDAGINLISLMATEDVLRGWD